MSKPGRHTREAYITARDRLRDEAARAGGTFEEKTFRPKDDEPPYFYATLDREFPREEAPDFAAYFTDLAFSVNGYLVLNIHGASGLFTLAVSGPCDEGVKPAALLTDPHTAEEKAALRDAGRGHLIR